MAVEPETGFLEGAPAVDRGTRLAWKLVIPLAVLLGVIILVFFVIFQTASVDGGSMLPTLDPADKLLVTKDYPSPTRGDIVIIHLLNQQGQSDDIVKRVIGLPGDVIEVREDVAWVNGVREPARGQVVIPTYADSYAPVTVPPNQVYVMGDNRAVSLDSRYIGTIRLPDLQGKVVAVFAPVQRVRLVN